MTRVVPGRPGVVSGLRPLTELREESAAGLEHLVELRLGRIVPGPWSRFGANAWGARYSAFFRDAELPPAAAQSLRDAGLERVESLAACEAEPGTFFVDGVADGGHRWGDGVTRWGLYQWADGRDMGVPTGLFEFEGDGLDLSGNGHNLTEVNGPAYAAAVQGDGAQLTLVTDRTDSPRLELAAAAAAAFDPGAESFNVAAKVRFDSAPGSLGQHIFTKKPGIGSGWSTRGSVGNVFTVGLKDDNATGSPTNAGSTTFLSGGSFTPGDGLFYSMVSVIDRAAGTVRLYVNGVDVGSKALTNPDLSYQFLSSSALWVGASDHGATNLDGRVDQVVFVRGRIWDAADALAYHAAPAGEPPGPNPLPPARWGAFPRLYVHLPDGSSPATTSIMAYSSVWLAGRGQAVPQFGREKLTDGGFEAWLSSSNLEHWVEDLASGITLEQETEEIREGSYAARVAFDGTSGVGGIYESHDAVPGQWYRLSCDYRTAPGMDAQDLALLRAGNPPDGWLEADGRGVGGSAQVALERTGGGWRRAHLDLIAHASTLRAWLGVEAASGSPGSVIFDRVSFRPIYGWHQAHPRLPAGNASTAELGTNDTFFGGDQVGRGDARILNGDGFAAELLGGFDSAGKEAQVYESGTFRDGQTIPADDWRPVFLGRTGRVTLNDDAAQLPLRDVRGDLHRHIPPRTYAQLDHPRLDRTQEGRRRPVFLGPKTGISPVRVDVTDDGFGVYELADTGWDLPFPLAPNGLKAVDAVYAYVSREAAEARVLAARALLTSGVHYSVDLAKGTLTVLVHLGPFILEDDLFLDFDVGASTLSAAITAGTYESAAELAAAVQASIRATIGGADVTGLCAFDAATKGYRVGRSSGTFNLRAESGPNRDLGVYALLGFAASADQTGMSSYLGAPVVTDIDQQHVIRVDAQGYADDASGTYTGSAGAVITRGADVARLVWHRFMGRPLRLVDEPSFAAARTSRPAPLGLYLRADQSTADVLEVLKLSTLSDVVIDGAGRISYLPYSSTVPASAEQLQDRDYLAWSMAVPVRDTYAEVVVEFDVDPATDTPRVRRKATPAVALVAGRPESKTVRTYLTVPNDAQALARDLATLAAAQPREVQLQLKSRLRDARPGTVVRITRDAGLDESGRLDDVAFRVAQVAVGERVELRLLELIELGV